MSGDIPLIYMLGVGGVWESLISPFGEGNTCEAQAYTGGFPE